MPRRRYRPLTVPQMINISQVVTRHRTQTRHVSIYKATYTFIWTLWTQVLCESWKIKINPKSAPNPSITMPTPVLNVADAGMADLSATTEPPNSRKYLWGSRTSWKETAPRALFRDGTRRNSVVTFGWASTSMCLLTEVGTNTPVSGSAPRCAVTVPVPRTPVIWRNTVAHHITF